MVFEVAAAGFHLRVLNYVSLSPLCFLKMENGLIKRDTEF